MYCSHHPVGGIFTEETRNGPVRDLLNHKQAEREGDRDQAYQRCSNSNTQLRGDPVSKAPQTPASLRSNRITNTPAVAAPKPITIDQGCVLPRQ